MKYLCLLGLFLISSLSALGQQSSESIQRDIIYTSNKDEYSLSRCKLDLYIPTDKTDFVTVIWYHGGGLTGGNKELPNYLKGKGIAVIGVGYRLSPKAKVSEIIGDAAQAVKWAVDHIGEFGGNKDKIVLSGHSAGAYLSLMLTLNPEYLRAQKVDANNLLGVVAFSSQAITHFTARQELGLGINQPIVNELAPLFWVRKDAPPITLITGDRELEMVGRYEENAYLARMLKIVGHRDVKLLELDGYDHGMTYPAFPILIKEIESWSKSD